MVDVKPVKLSIALAVSPPGALDSRDGLVVLVRRPEQDDEFPGMWGLPAASCLAGETPLQTAQRAGLQKLGAQVEVGAVLASGEQQRSEYTLEMILYRARLAGGEPRLGAHDGNPGGLTFYTHWRWGRPEELRESAENGSLCSRLLLDYVGPTAGLS